MVINASTITLYQKTVTYLLKWQTGVMFSGICNVLQGEWLVKHTQISSWSFSIVSNLLSIKTLESTTSTENLKDSF